MACACLAQGHRPVFAEYPAARYDGNIAPPRVPDDQREDFGFRVALSEADRPINFAGHYRISRDTCGSECTRVMLTDVITGRVDEALGLSWSYRFAFPKLPTGIEHRQDSNLLIGHGCLNDERKCGDHYWKMTPRGLVEIRWIPYKGLN